MRTESPEKAVVTVGIVEPLPLLREGLRTLIQTESGMRCIGAWEHPGRASGEVGDGQPDVILYSLTPGIGCGIDPLAELCDLSRCSKPIILLDCADFDCPVVPHPRGARSGSTGSAENRPLTCRRLVKQLRPFVVVHKGISFEALREIIWRTAARNGKSSFEPSSAPSIELTARERQVAYLISLGRSNPDIAAELGLSYSTVKNYVSSILAKRNLKHRTQIALHVIQSDPQ